MKRGLDWYKREQRSILDAIRAAGMTDRQAAIYNIILDLIYDGGGETPDDPKHIASYLSNVGTAAARSTIQQLIDMGKIHRVGKMLGSEAWRLESTREAVSAALRAEIFERDGSRCRYCGQDEGPHEIDHVFPVSRGGKTEAENLTVACRPCNRSKGARTLEEWIL